MESIGRVLFCGDREISLHSAHPGENILLMPKNLILGVSGARVSQAPRIEVIEE